MQLMSSYESGCYYRVKGSLLRSAFHLVCDFSWFSVVREVHTIVTELQFVLGYPVIIKERSISSLRSYTCCFSVQTAQVDLKPLTEIICGNHPATCLKQSPKKIKPSLMGGLISIPLGRGSNLVVSDSTVFHTKSSLAL